MITIIFFATGYTMSKVQLFHAILPISYNDYWFFTNFLILYLISPILNTVIKNIDKIKFKKIIISLCILMFVLPYMTNNAFFNNNGYSLYNFIVLYFIGAYLRIYPIQKNYFMKVFTRNSQKLILFIIILVMALSDFLLIVFGTNLMNCSNKLIVDIGHILSDNWYSYSNPFIVLQSIAYFLFFSLLNFKSKIINKIAKYIFGVYLISDNLLVSGWLYNFLGFIKVSYNWHILLYVLECAIFIFSICIIIEAIRQFIFKKIYDTKFAYKFRMKCRSYIESLGININW